MAAPFCTPLREKHAPNPLFRGVPCAVFMPTGIPAAKRSLRLSTLVKGFSLPAHTANSAQQSAVAKVHPRKIAPSGHLGVPGKPVTLCWDCSRAAGPNMCRWARGFLPVRWWVAQPTVHMEHYGAELHEVHSFCVSECPLFVPDRR